MEETSSTRTTNGVPVTDIVRRYDIDSTIERVGGFQLAPLKLEVVEPDSQWPNHFQTYRSRILNALDPTILPPTDARNEGNWPEVLSIKHVGSTSVPGLPAKALIDIDLVLSDVSIACESFYVTRLESVGLHFCARNFIAEHEHRYFRTDGGNPGCSMHVWGPRSAEAERHLVFRDWLRTHEQDRDLYAQTKRECAAIAREKGETTVQYSARKSDVIQDIMQRAFKALGHLKEDAGHT